MKEVLITGAAGLIGRAVMRRLLRRPDVERIIGTDIRPNRDLAIKKMDITVIDDVTRFVPSLDSDSAIVHLAARVAGPPSIKKPWTYIYTNVMGTLNILEAMRRTDCKKMVFLSSWSTFGSDISLPIDEETPQRPQNPYGISKVMAEKEVELYAKLYGLEIVTLRPTMIYGPEQTEKNHVQQIADSMHTGKAFEIWGKGSHTRELLYVDDMAEIISRAIDYRPEGGYDVFVVGTENPLSVKDVAEAGYELTENFRIDYVPSNKWVFSQRSDMTKIKREMEINPKGFTDISTGLWNCLLHRLSKR